MKYRLMLGEAVSASRCQPVVSLICCTLVAAMVAAVMLTTGRAVGAQVSVTSSIDAASSRSIVIRAEPTAGLKAAILERIELIDGISWSIGFGPAIDSNNSKIMDGPRVPVRLAYGESFTRLGVPETIPLPDVSLYASERAEADFGAYQHAAGVTASTGRRYSLAGTAKVPPNLRFLEPLAIVPSTATEAAVLTVVVIVAKDPSMVRAVSGAVASSLGNVDSSKISIESSRDLEQLRQDVDRQLGRFGRNLVAAILGVTGLLVAVMLFCLVLLRRKDFGRRRALGASRSFIVVLMLTQTGIMAAVGTAGGLLTSTAVLILGGDPLPTPKFYLALSVAAVCTAVAATAFPARMAADRDPIRELRVP